jgi:hypothetical protein
MSMNLVTNSTILDAEAFDGLLVDFGGVVTRTATLHASACSQALSTASPPGNRATFLQLR